MRGCMQGVKSSVLGLTRLHNKLYYCCCLFEPLYSIPSVSPSKSLVIQVERGHPWRIPPLGSRMTWGARTVKGEPLSLVTQSWAICGRDWWVKRGGCRARMAKHWQLNGVPQPLTASSKPEVLKLWRHRPLRTDGTQKVCLRFSFELISVNND